MDEDFDRNATATRVAPKVFGLESPERLKQWLLESGRTFLIFESADLVDALPWPHGVEAVQQVVAAYRQHRLVHQKEETLSADEIDAAILSLAHEARRLQPDWTFETLEKSARRDGALPW